MPAPFYRVCTPITGADKKTRWCRIGTATYDPAKDRIRVTLDALPFRAETLMCFPEDGSRGGARPDNRAHDAQEHKSDRDPPPTDDDIPF